jgi:hypothetical protein
LQTGNAQHGGVWLISSAKVASAAVPEVSQPPPQLMTLGWALRRAALGLLILLTAAGLSAWLLYASIEPDGTAGAGTRGEYALPSG